VVLATKFTGPMGDGINRKGHSRKWILEEVDNSLRRLGTDYIDLYQAHRPDLSTDLDELLGTLSDLIHVGKVRAIGSSTFPAHHVVEAQWVSERRGRERFQCEQPPYSIFVRGIERDVLPVCEKYGIGVIPWSPLAGGWLGGKHRKGQPAPTSGRAAMQPQRFDPERPEVQQKLDLVEDLVAVAEGAGLSLIDLALGFVTAHPAVTSAIIGPRTMEQLEDQLGALELKLADDVLDRIDEIVPPGTNLNAGDAGWEPPSIADKRKRRRINP
jgi:aryl-alcohol dehydrogenase-like predicted oxidoreductase